MKISTLVLTGFFLSVAFGINAQSTHQWKTANSNGYTYKYVTNDPMKARFYTLKNGLTVILTENDKEPRVAINVAIRAGSNTDPRTHTGLAHYLEHILFKGTDQFGVLDWQKEKPYIDSITQLYEKYTKLTDAGERKKMYAEIDRLSGEASKYSIANEYDKLMKDIGSQGTNAHTSVEETVYKENIPSNSMDKFLLIQAERFRKPVIRIFHTELEAVYEEKNRSLDNDGSKMWEVMNYHLFPTHNYGQQTTIGTIEHLKSPSIKAIQNYYDQYYVPNNMAVIMSGDFKSDELIQKIDQHFSYMKPAKINEYNPAPERDLTAAIEKDVFGPSAESMRIGFRTPGANTPDALVVSAIADLLSNGAAGLLDINLNKNQKVQGAQAGVQRFKDHGIFLLLAAPKEGQSLEELKPLLLAELEKIKSGDFDASLIKSIAANYKLSRLKGLDNNNNRLNELMNSYIQSKGQKWDFVLSEVDQLSNLTKARIQQVANKYFGNNYVLINKRKGEDKNIVKVEKPSITPVETNAGKSSPFVQKINAMKVSNIHPVWVDYKKDISYSKAGIADVMYVPNKDNDLFNLYYRFDIGAWNDPSLAYAAEYLQFLSTDSLTNEQINKAFYDIACSYRVSVSNETTTVSITGLQENFDKAVELFEHVIANVKPDEEALSLLKGRWSKARANNKLNKASIARGLMSYAQFGKNNPFNTVLSDAELNDLKPEILVNKLKDLLNYEHKIIYYGPLPLKDITASVTKKHRLPAQFTAIPAVQIFKYATQDKNQVLFAEYDMVQSEIYWIRNIKPYDFSQEAVVSVFNDYFGGGMGSMVFQTIRESKALAYSTNASYGIPGKKEDPFTQMAYVGSQSDKMTDAINAMNELLNELPVSQQAFELAKANIIQGIETGRIVKDGIIFNYLNLQRKGLDRDVRKDIYETVKNMSIKDMIQLHKNDVAAKPYTYAVVGSEKRLKMDELEKIGEVKKLSLEEIFGY